MQTCFYHLSEYQNYDFQEYLYNQIVKKAFLGQHKIITYQRLIKHTLANSKFIHEEARNALTNEECRLFKNL